MVWIKVSEGLAIAFEDEKCAEEEAASGDSHQHYGVPVGSLSL
jgi:hypothetical protein